MLTYQDVMTIKLGALTNAATAWDHMAEDLGKMEGVYNAKVKKVPEGGGWTGIAAGAAAGQFAATSRQYVDAQTEARAIASLLRDAHGQFTRLVGEVKRIVASAEKQDLSVNSQGQAVYDRSKLTPHQHDPDYEKYLAQVTKSEDAWTKKIKDAVQAVDDADQGVKLALRDAAGIKSLFERMADEALGQGHGFNGRAKGDIEYYEALEAKAYADEILDGKKPSDPAEWRRLMRDNSDNKVFSQTFLDSLGLDKTLKLSNKIDDLAYVTDTKQRDAYLDINGGISDSLATATRVPDFYDDKGKRLRYGTEAYKSAFSGWYMSPQGSFYKQWQDDVWKLGDKKYESKFAGERVAVGPGAKQDIDGFQSLVTLMKQGHDYSPQFVADVTDQAIEAEKKNPDIWDLHGKFSGKGDGGGWLANDPVDGALQVMAHTPEGAAGYLDPGTPDGKARYDYLVGNRDDSRDWNVIDTTEDTGKAQIAGADKMDADNRRGLGDALAAAATGHDPSGSADAPTRHTAANNRVFHATLESFSDQGDDMPASLRESMAKIMVNHGDEVYQSMSRIGGQSNDPLTSLDQHQVMEVAKQISRSQESYGMLHEGMNYAITKDIHDSSRSPEDTLHSAGHAIGFMEEARYNALKGDQHDYTWDKAWSYHSSGAVLNFIPGVGDLAQRGADVVTSKWIMDEQQHQADQLTANNQATYTTRQNQLDEIAGQWYAVNSDWAGRRDGYSLDQGVHDQIAAAANDGNKRADGLAGDQ
ncbi:hypothetical protein OG698_17275 [Streptomyces sp. NBC_01003]|uniref:hypothetical protein n=1 Tax=Streptomyces sp. NBC_01003 TaxID=2903714 RepID=UPI003865FDA5|nr:hypothetical protein OG698_17275 [Streptomyces sp. NBC_01003]